MKAFAGLLVLASCLWAGQAEAAALTITKTPTPVSDPINGTLAPKILPGAIIDYNILVRNPNAVTVTRAIVVTDAITELAVPQGAEYFVGTLGSAGPIVFSDGNVLGMGLFSSGLTYTYTSLSSTTDSLSFSNDGGISWTYVPAPDAAGYDSRITHIRVSPAGNFAVLSGFNVRLRVRIRQ